MNISIWPCPVAKSTDEDVGLEERCSDHFQGYLGLKEPLSYREIPFDNRSTLGFMVYDSWDLHGM